MNTQVIVIPANTTTVRALAARYDMTVPSAIQVAFHDAASAIRSTMQQPQLYASLPPADAEPDHPSVVHPLACTQVHPYVNAALLINLQAAYHRVTGAPLDIGNDIMVYIADNWRLVNTLSYEVLDLVPSMTEAVDTAFPDLPTITLAPNQKNAAPGKPRKSLFQTEIPIRQREAPVPFWLKEINSMVRNVFVLPPGDCITDGSRATTRAMSYGVIIDLLQRALVDAPGDATVEDLRAWMRGVTVQISASPSGPAVAAFVKHLQALQPEKAGKDE